MSTQSNDIKSKLNSEEIVAKVEELCKSLECEMEIDYADEMDHPASYGLDEETKGIWFLVKDKRKKVSDYDLMFHLNVSNEFEFSIDACPVPCRLHTEEEKGDMSMWLNPYPKPLESLTPEIFVMDFIKYANGYDDTEDEIEDDTQYPTYETNEDDEY